MFSFPVAAVPLYGYGVRENDQQYVERRVDFNSPLFKPETGFPFGKTLRNSLYVSLPWLDLLSGKRLLPKTWGRHQVPGMGPLQGQINWNAARVCLQQEMTLWPFWWWLVVAFLGCCSKWAWKWEGCHSCVGGSHRSCPHLMEASLCSVYRQWTNHFPSLRQQHLHVP